jgi:hypothetical protein
VNDKCEEMCEFKYEIDFEWGGFLELDNKKYKTNANGVLEEYEVPPVDDDDVLPL